MENNASFQTLDAFNKSKNLTLEEFQKQLPRKMTIHLLSDQPKDCKDFIKFFTTKEMKNSNKLEENMIKDKINLYSFMNYKIYEDVSLLIKEIETKANNAFKNVKSYIFSELLIILDNDGIEK